MNNFTSNSPTFSREFIFRPLEKSKRFPDSMGTDNCPWLLEFNNFCKVWSPRSPDDFYSPIAMGVLSTIAAGRVTFPLGKMQNASLYIVLVGRSSLTAKTTLLQIGKDVIHESGMDYLLLPDSCTPEKMISDMSLKLPDNYQDLSSHAQEEIINRLANAGQRGMCFGEFGSQLQAIMKPNGNMSMYRGLIRQFDDGEKVYSHGTILRGTDIVQNPSLTIIGAMTPADLRPFAVKDSLLWGDGFFARIMLIYPLNDEIKRGRFPNEIRSFPNALINPLVEWDQSLGQRKIHITDSGIELEPFQPKVLTIPNETYEAYYEYSDELTNMLKHETNQDLDSSYGRMPTKAIRIGALIASLEKSSEILPKHFVIGRKITEQYREGLHKLHKDVTSDHSMKALTPEQKVENALKNYGPLLIREIEQHTHIPANDIRRIVTNSCSIKRLNTKPDQNGIELYTLEKDVITD